MSNQNYLVIIGDVIKSRDIKDRGRFQSIFQDEINTHMSFPRPVDIKNNIVSQFTITIGDEFQGVLNLASNLFKFILNFELAIKGHKSYNKLNFRYGFGVGKIVTKINRESAIGMDGPAFYHARESIEKAKKFNLKYCFKSTLKEDDNINTLLQWLSLETQKWNYRKSQIFELYINSRTQKQIAESLDISQPAVSKTLKNAPVELVIKTENLIEHEINKILGKVKNLHYSMVADSE